MLWKFLTQDVLLPKGLNLVQDLVQELADLVYWRGPQASARDVNV